LHPTPLQWSGMQGIYMQASLIINLSNVIRSDD
jgi:hypothetical protein